MKKFSKIIALIVSAVFVMTALIACAGGGNTSTSEKKDNAKPTIEGVQDMAVEAESEINVLAGVTATDKEDGDLTSKITVESSPALTFTNGKATPATAGTYELIFSVTDNDGETAEAYATLTVTRKTAAATLYKEFDFSTQAVTDNKGWVANIWGDETVATATLKQGAYVLDITNPGVSDDRVRLDKMIDVKAADYKLRVWAKATKETYMHMIAKKDVEAWETYGGDWNKRIGTTMAAYDMNFSVAEEGRAELRLHFGKITPNGENPADTTPENFSVIIDKIEIYEITGAESNVKKYEADFSKEAGLAVSAGDGAEGVASYADGKAVATITSYPTSGGVWSIKADLSIGGEKLENGKKYYYSVTLVSQNEQPGECVFESASNGARIDASFNGFTAAAGEEKVLSGVFMADKDIDDAVIRLQIGNPATGVTANVITVSAVEFGVVEGDKDVKKSIDNFVAFGNGTALGENPAYPWFTFNGSDEDHEGVGTIWMEEGKLYYRIDQGGETDWYNKLVCGYRENPLTLEADSYYTLEITVKADKAVSCGLFLNPIGSWDPRVSKGMDITTEAQTFTFATTETLITDMNFELLFQFGSGATKALGEVTIEFLSIKIYQTKVL